MPRRVFTYPEAIGWDWLNLDLDASAPSSSPPASSSCVATCCARSAAQPDARAQPVERRHAGMAQRIRRRTGACARCRMIESRYPLWDQPDFVREIDDGRFYLPDAEEGWRETLVTSVLDAEPVQCLRVAGNSWLPMLAAAALGGVFVCADLPLVALLARLRRRRPLRVDPRLAVDRHGARSRRSRRRRRPRPDACRSTPPGRASVGWWAHVHHHGRRRHRLRQPGLRLLLLLDDPRRLHRRPAGPRRRLADGRPGLVRRRLGRDARRAPAQQRAAPPAACALALGASLRPDRAWAAPPASLGPWTAGMDPTRHVYPAIVWMLVVWTAGPCRRRR